MTDRPRWIISSWEKKEIVGDFIGQADRLDVYAGSSKELYGRPITVVRNPIPETKHNYTSVAVTNGALDFADRDVVPSPYEMCLIYQLYEEYKNDRCR